MDNKLDSKWEHPNKLSDELISKIKEYYNEGHTCQQTADKFGVGKTTVRSYVKTRPRKTLTDKERRAKRVESVSKRRRKLKQMAVEYKGGSCEKCGYDKYAGAFDFHHVDPTEKDFAFSTGGYSLSWARIKKELDKCILLCANCHREVHGEL